MKKKQNIVFALIESLFYIACAGAVVSGRTDYWINQVPFIGYGVAFLTLALIIGVIVTMNRPITPYHRFRALLGITLLAITAVYLTSPERAMSFAYPTSPLFFLYFVVIISYAVMGNGAHLWVVLTLCIAGEAANCAVHGYLQEIFTSQGFSWMGASARWQTIVRPFMAMVFTAVVPFFITLLKNPSSARAAARSAPLVHPTAEPQPPTPDSLRATVSIDNRALLHSGKTSLILKRQDGDEAGAGQSDIDDILSSVVYFMSRNFKAYSALGFVFDPVGQVFTLNSFHSKSLSIVKNVRIPLGRGLVGKVGADKTIFISGDLTNYNTELLYYAGGSPVKSVVVTPVMSDAKELMGALVIDSQDFNAFKDEHKEILRRFSSLAAALIFNARMRQYQERTATQFQIFYEASQQFIPALHTDQVFAVLISIAQQVAAYTRIVALSFSEADSVCTVVKTRGPSPDLAEGFSFTLNAGLYSYALQKQKIVNVADFQEFRGKYYRFTPEEVANPFVRSLIIIPIMSEASLPVGLLSIEHSEPNCYLGDMETILFTLVGNASVAFTRARLYHKMELLAITDGLTQLINHKQFQTQLSKEIERSRRYKRPLSLLILDIDHFKSFNDTYGHQVGDLVLREISRCIQSVLRINDQAARYGGEEFAVIIPETTEQGALATAERIRTKIESYVITSGTDKLRVTVSIGAATYPLHADNQQALIADADTALYHAKESGRNQSCLYVQGMKAHGG